jgi:hypothetical protein
MSNLLSWRVLALSVVVYAILYFLASRAVYYPEKYPGGFWDMQRRLGAVDVWLQTTDSVRRPGVYGKKGG